MAAYVQPLAKEPRFYNINDWLDMNRDSFLPPVCNKMMHNTQLKVFYVGGPNQRRDYHLEEGEELFYMKKGDMCLKTVQAGQFKDVVIREGEVFLLPARIPHSPQRFRGTMGLVVERERLAEERDGLRYFVEGGSPEDVLYQRWFHCKDLGSELAPIIDDFFASEQCRTGKPLQKHLEENPSCWEEDRERKTDEPFNLKDWIQKNRKELSGKGMLHLFDASKYQSDIRIFGKGKQDIVSDGGETFLWQVEGTSKVTLTNVRTSFSLNPDDSLLIPSGKSYEVDSREDESAVVLSVKMDPRKQGPCRP